MRRRSEFQSKRLIFPELPSDAYIACSEANANPMKTLCQSPASNWSSVSSDRPANCRPTQRPVFWRSKMVSEFRPGPVLAVTTVLPEGLTAIPNAPGPVRY